MYICFYIITDFALIFELVPCKSCQFKNLLTEAGVMHEAGYVDYLEHLVPLLKLDINILSILHYLGSPLGFCTLIFDLMRNLYIYNACIYIHSIDRWSGGLPAFSFFFFKTDFPTKLYIDLICLFWIYIAFNMLNEDGILF